MNWEAVGTIAEIIGAVGVIASLLYLAVQIRQSTKVARAETTKDLYLASRDAILQIASNDALAKIWTNIRNFESEEIAESYTLIIRMLRLSQPTFNNAPRCLEKTGGSVALPPAF